MGGAGEEGEGQRQTDRQTKGGEEEAHMWQINIKETRMWLSPFTSIPRGECSSK